MALCDEHARSAKIFWLEPRSAYRSRTLCCGTCLSCAPEAISVGIFVLPATAEFQPQFVTCGARRTPLPHVAPTGSDSIIADHTESLAAGSYWSGHPTWRFQFSVNSSCDCVFMAAPFAGTCAGGSPAALRL